MRIKDMEKVNRFSRILKNVMKDANSYMGGISVVDAGMDSETSADFGSLGQIAREIQNQIPNVSPDKAMEMARERVNNNGFSDFIISQAERRKSNSSSAAEHMAFGEVEKLIKTNSGNGDFSNEIQSLRRQDEVIMEKVKQLQTDFTNHIDEHHRGVDSVESQVSDFSLEHNDKSIRFDINDEADFTNEGSNDTWGEPKFYNEFSNDGVIDAGRARLATNMDFVPRSKRTSFSDIVKGMKSETNVYKKAGKVNTGVVNNALNKLKSFFLK